MSKIRNKKLGRAFTCDVAITYRMASGFAGDVNRGQPFKAEPVKQDVQTPVLGYGYGCVCDTADNSVRQMAAGDTAVTRLYGVIAREYPTQQAATTNFGQASIGGTLAPPATGVLTCLRDGAIMVPVQGSPTKDGAVFIWVAANSGSHVQGGFEAAATGGSTAAIANARFNGPPGADGICELQINQT